MVPLSCAALRMIPAHIKGCHADGGLHMCCFTWCSLGKTQLPLSAWTEWIIYWKWREKGSLELIPFLLISNWQSEVTTLSIFLVAHVLCWSSCKIPTCGIQNFFFVLHSTLVCVQNWSWGAVCATETYLCFDWLIGVLQEMYCRQNPTHCAKSFGVWRAVALSILHYTKIILLEYFLKE